MLNLFLFLCLSSKPTLWHLRRLPRFPRLRQHFSCFVEQQLYCHKLWTDNNFWERIVLDGVSLILYCIQNSFYSLLHWSWEGANSHRRFVYVCQQQHFLCMNCQFFALIFCCLLLLKLKRAVDVHLCLQTCLLVQAECWWGSWLYKFKN